MKMNYQIAEQYAKLIFDSHVKGRSFKPLLVEVFSKYNNNFLLTEADLKDSVKQVYAELIAKFRGMATKDKTAENYYGIIKGLAQSILKFYDKNVTLNRFIYINGSKVAEANLGSRISTKNNNFIGKRSDLKARAKSKKATKRRSRIIHGKLSRIASMRSTPWAGEPPRYI